MTEQARALDRLVLLHTIFNGYAQWGILVAVAAGALGYTVFSVANLGRQLTGLGRWCQNSITLWVVGFLILHYAILAILVPLFQRFARRSPHGEAVEKLVEAEGLLADLTPWRRRFRAGRALELLAEIEGILGGFERFRKARVAAERRASGPK